MISRQKLIEENIQDSILRNAIGPVSIGSKCTVVLEHFGKPEATASSSRRKRPDLWKYGDVEISFDREADFSVEYMKFRLYPTQVGVNGWGQLRIVDDEVMPGMPLAEFVSILAEIGLNMTEKEYALDEMRLFLIGATEIFFEGKGPHGRLHSIYLKQNSADAI